MNVFGQFDNKDVSVTVSELLVATADSSDALLDDSVEEVLHALRKQMNLDVVFVSEIVDGKRVFRFVNAGAGGLPLRAGESSPVEETFCQRILDGRMPELVHDVAALPASLDLPPTPVRIGAHLSTPIVLQDGRSYGTLCCFSASPNPALNEKDLRTLRNCAVLVARKLELAAERGIPEPPAEWAIEPTTVYESRIWDLR